MGQAETKLSEDSPPSLGKVKEETELDEETINICWKTWRKDSRISDGKADLHDWLKFLNLETEEAKKDAEMLFKLLDKDSDGDLEFPEAMLFLFSTKKDLSQEQTLARSFRFYDRKGDKKISKKEMVTTLLLLGKLEEPEEGDGVDKKFPVEVENLFSLMDFGGDGKIHISEFLRATKHYRKLGQLLTIDYFEDHRRLLLKKVEGDRLLYRNEAAVKKNKKPLIRQSTI